jgi:SulP family sulfate permease
MTPHHWDWRGLTIGGVTVLAVLLAPKLTRTVPGTISAILAGILTNAAITSTDSSMLQPSGNSLVVGLLGASSEGYFELITERWNQIGELKLSQVAGLVGSAITLAALLSIDTLKTCVVLEQMTRSRHDPNRELAAQGFANVVASGIGGMPGAGTMGVSLVNLSSGTRTRISGIIEGVMVLGSSLAIRFFCCLDSHRYPERYFDRRRLAHDRHRSAAFS